MGNTFPKGMMLGRTKTSHSGRQHLAGDVSRDRSECRVWDMSQPGVHKRAGGDGGGKGSQTYKLMPTMRKKKVLLIRRVVLLVLYCVVLIGGLGYFQPPSGDIRGWASCAIVIGPILILAGTSDGCCVRSAPPLALWTGDGSEALEHAPLLSNGQASAEPAPGTAAAEEAALVKEYQEYV